MKQTFLHGSENPKKQKARFASTISTGLFVEQPKILFIWAQHGSIFIPEKRQNLVFRV